MYNTRDANFLTRNLTFSGKLAISPSIYSDWRRKSRHFDGGRHVSSLGVPPHYPQRYDSLTPLGRHF